MVMIMMYFVRITILPSQQQSYILTSIAGIELKNINVWSLPRPLCASPRLYYFEYHSQILQLPTVKGV